jgi:hypothetical protein
LASHPCDGSTSHGWGTQLFLDGGCRGRFGAFNQALRESEAGTQQALAAGHFAFIGLVVVAGEVQEAVQDEDFDFGGK